MLVSALSFVVAAAPFTLGAPVQVAPVGVSPSIDCSPTECVVAWIQYDNGPDKDACVAFATFSAQKPTPVVSQLTCEGGVPAVAASPNATLISWSTSKHLMGTAITNGRPGPIFKIPVEQRPDSIDAAFDGQRFVLVWSTSKQVSMLRLSPKAQLFDEKPLVLATGRVVSSGSVGCARGKCLVTLLEHTNQRPQLSAVMVENGVPAPTPLSTEALEAIVTTSSNALMVLSTDALQVVRTTPGAPPHGVFGSTTGRMRDLEAASFAERTLVGWVVEENGPRGIELMLLPVDGQTRGVVGATLDGEFDPAFATADGKTFWVVTNRWPEKNRGDWPTVAIRKLSVP